MNINNSKEVTEIFKEVAEFINDVGMRAIVLTEAEGAPAVSLLAGLQGEVEEGHYVVCSCMEPDQEEEGLAAYYQLFYEIPLDTDELDDFAVLQAVNAMNAVTKVGHFIWKKSKTGSRIHLRHAIVLTDEEELKPEIICECSQTLLDYALVMEGIIAALASGLDIRKVLADNELNLEV